MLATDKSVSFPSQEVIINFISSLPVKKFAIDTPFMDSSFPGSLAKVAKYFENKKMSLSEIPNNIKMALRNEDDEKLDDLKKGLRKLIDSCEKREGKDDGFTFSMKKILSNAEDNPSLNIATAIYNQALIDLIDGATYTPPIGEEREWVRHVVKITE